MRQRHLGRAAAALLCAAVIAAQAHAAGPCQLMVMSRPAGAAVHIDGKERGRTPVAIMGMKIGYSPRWSSWTACTPNHPAPKVGMPGISTVVMVGYLVWRYPFWLHSPRKPRGTSNRRIAWQACIRLRQAR